MVISFQRNNIDGTAQLDKLEEEIGPEVDIYHGNKEKTPLGQLRQAKKEWQKRRNNRRKIREEWQEKLAEESKENNLTATKATIL
eukprot:10165972-Ditylum_brightwellii.AAC.1